MRRSVIWSVMVWVSIAWGQVTINGPDKITRDTFGEWALAGGQVDRSTFDWEIIPLDARSAPDWSRKFATKFTPTNDGVLLVGAPGKYELKVLMVGPSGDDRRPFNLTKLKRFIEIEGAVDPVPPPPGPRPLPLPDGKFGLANSTAAWVVSQVKVESRSKAKALADSFRQMVKTIASSQAAGVAWDREAILDATTKQNSEALGDQRDSWLEWATSLQVRLDQLYAAGSLKSADDYKQAFTEIAVGLESVK